MDVAESASEGCEVVEMCQWLQEWGDRIVEGQEQGSNAILDGLSTVSGSIKDMGRAIAAQTQLLSRLLGPQNQGRSLPETPSASSASDASGPPSETAVAPTRVDTIQTVVMVPKTRRPKFCASVKRPMRFLEEFEAYVRESRTTEGNKLNAAIDCLYGSAKNWADMYMERWTTYSDFRKDFLETYWSENEQVTLRHDIGSDRWDPDDRETMLEHFTKYVSKAKQLTVPMTESVLVSELMRHFPKRVQSLWQVCARPSLSHAFAFLKNQQATGTVERSPTRTTADTREQLSHHYQFEPYPSRLLPERHPQRFRGKPRAAVPI